MEREREKEIRKGGGKCEKVQMHIRIPEEIINRMVESQYSKT